MAHTTIDVAGNVRAETARRQVSQSDVANALGLDRANVSRRMSGKTEFTPNQLTQLAELLDVPVGVFFVEHPQTTSAVRSVPDPGADGGGSSASASVTGADAEDISAA